MTDPEFADRQLTIFFAAHFCAFLAWAMVGHSGFDLLIGHNFISLFPTPLLVWSLWCE